jgi:predicted nucleic acid-binding protein
VEDRGRRDGDALRRKRRSVKAILDSSVVLRFLLNGDDSLRASEGMEWVGASELLYIECHRVLERARVQRKLDELRHGEAIEWLARFFEGLEFLPIDSRVVRKAARPYPILLKTLDAIHLATLETACGEDETRSWCLVTLDGALARAARSIGFTTLPEKTPA